MYFFMYIFFSQPIPMIIYFIIINMFIEYWLLLSIPRPKLLNQIKIICLFEAVTWPNN